MDVPRSPTELIMAKGVTLKDVAADQFITAYAAQLKKAGQIELPAWSGIMKTASWKDLSPYDADWYFVRCGAHLLLLVSRNY
jgi:small subunit ribosomal protein S19e